MVGNPLTCKHLYGICYIVDKKPHKLLKKYEVFTTVRMMMMMMFCVLVPKPRTPSLP
jgi:hypothetical protein